MQQRSIFRGSELLHSDVIITPRYCHGRLIRENSFIVRFFQQFIYLFIYLLLNIVKHCWMSCDHKLSNECARCTCTVAEKTPVLDFYKISTNEKRALGTKLNFTENWSPLPRASNDWSFDCLSRILARRRSFWLVRLYSVERLSPPLLALKRLSFGSSLNYCNF